MFLYKHLTVKTGLITGYFSYLILEVKSTCSKKQKGNVMPMYM